MVSAFPGQEGDCTRSYSWSESSGGPLYPIRVRQKDHCEYKARLYIKLLSQECKAQCSCGQHLTEWELYKKVSMLMCMGSM